jgi:hypothetical protein
MAGTIRRVAYDGETADLVADFFATTARLAPYTLPGATVHQITVPGKDGRPSVLLTLWPSLRRADAVSAGATVVVGGIVAVEFVPGVEVTFRKEGGGYLIVTLGGKVIVRA